MQCKLKKIFINFKEEKINRENIFMTVMGLIILLGLATLPYFWYCFSFKLGQGMKAIDSDQNLKGSQEIELKDFEEIDAFFGEREKRYQEGSGQKLPEIF